VTVAGLARSLAPWCWRFAAVAAVAVVLARAVVPDTFYGLAAVSLLVACAYGALVLPLTLRDPLEPYVRPRLNSLSLMLRRALRRADAPEGVGK
jgi:hypothetical protein